MKIWINRNINETRWDSIKLSYKEMMLSCLIDDTISFSNNFQPFIKKSIAINRSVNNKLSHFFHLKQNTE